MTKTGILLVNLGTPDEPTPRTLRRYLAQFLADPRIVNLPRWLWLPILYGIILNTRPARSARAYRRIWSEDGSPLLLISQQLTEAVSDRITTHFSHSLQVELGMRYGNPSLQSVLEKLKSGGLDRLLVIPLFPQFSISTTSSIFDALTAKLQSWHWIPELRFINDYHTHPLYISALAASIREHWQEHGQSDRLLMSFHGIPASYVAAGDPYEQQCHTSAQLLAEALELTDDQWVAAFQSRFGPAEWLQPYTDEMFMQLPSQGVASLDVICPGFAADCLETLDEIAHEGGETFLHAGGRSLKYIPALNSRPAHIELLTNVILERTQDWQLLK